MTHNPLWDCLRALAKRLSDPGQPPIDEAFFRRSLARLQKAQGYEPAILASLWNACVESERLDCLQALADAGAPLERPHHKSALSWAVHKGALPACDLLLKAGANPNGQPDGFDPPLVDAIRKNRPDIALLLLDAGANPNPSHAQGSGMPPIHWAILHGDAPVVAALLARGADPLAPGLAGLAPLAAAELFKQPACAGLISSFLQAQTIELSLRPGARAPKAQPLSL